MLKCGSYSHPRVRRAAPARVRERVSSPSAVDAAPREGSKKSLADADDADAADTGICARASSYLGMQTGLVREGSGRGQVG